MKNQTKIPPLTWKNFRKWWLNYFFEWIWYAVIIWIGAWYIYGMMKGL